MGGLIALATIPRQSVAFETGDGVADSTPVNLVKKWSVLPAHAFDPEQILPAGTTELWLDNTVAAVPNEGWNGRWVVLYSDPTDPTKPRRRHLVQVLTSWVEVDEPVDASGTLRSFRVAHGLNQDVLTSTAKWSNLIY